MRTYVWILAAVALGLSVGCDDTGILVMDDDDTAVFTSANPGETGSFYGYVDWP